MFDTQTRSACWIAPQGSRVVVERVVTDRFNEEGPAGAADRKRAVCGRVLAAGSARDADDERDAFLPATPLPVEPGDLVVYERRDGVDATVDGREITFLNWSDVLAVLPG